MILLRAVFFLGCLIPFWGSTEPIPLNEDHSIIVEVTLKSYPISDGILVYSHEDQILIPFQELLDLLDYPINLELDKSFASGWFVKEDNTIEIDFEQKTVYLKGQIANSDSLEYSTDEFDFFVDSKWFKKWFGLDFSLNLGQLRLIINSDITQPIEARIIRESLRKKKQDRERKSRNYPVMPDHYHWLGPMAADVQLQSSYSETSNHSVSIQSAGDILKHESRFNYYQSNAINEPVAKIRLNKYPSKPNTDALPGITQYSLGDVFVQSQDLISNGHEGTGFIASKNTEHWIEGSFSSQDFEGQSIPGWEVELYRNGLLLDYQVVDEQGRYLFSNVDIEFGENFFEIKLFGPQGQKQIRKERISVGRNLIRPGHWSYQVSGLKTQNRVLTGAIDSEKESYDVFGLNTMMGLNTQHSVGMGFFQNPIKNQTLPNQYIRLGLNSSFPWLSSQMQWVQDRTDQGQAMRLDLVGSIPLGSYKFSSENYEDFKSEKNSFGNILKEHNLSLNGRIWVMPYSLGITEKQFASDTKSRQLDNRLSYFNSGTKLSNNLTHIFATESTESKTSGTLSISSQKNNFRLRNSTGYILTTEEVSNTSLSVNYKAKRWSSNFTVIKSFGDNSVTGLTSSIGSTLGNFIWSVDSSWDSEQQFSVGISLKFGLFANPIPTLESSGFATQGNLQPQVFLDEDNDGEFSDNDTALEGVSFEGRSAWKSSQTDEEGQLILRGMDVKKGSLIRLNTSTLDDPYLQPMLDEFRVISHAGAFREIAVPVSEVTEVEGNLLLKQGSRTKGIGGVELGLFKDGELRHKTRSEFDGYYLFSEVFPGEYQLQLLISSDTKQDLVIPDLPSVKTNSIEGFTLIEDIVLIKK